jgi:hypothetical protein
MTATEQRTSGLFPHQSGRTSPKTVSCVSSNVGSIQDFLFPSSHSTFPSSPNDIPLNEIHQESLSSPSPPPQILIHTTSEQCIDINQEQQEPSTTINQTVVRNFEFNFEENYFVYERYLKMIMNHRVQEIKKNSVIVVLMKQELLHINVLWLMIL